MKKIETFDNFKSVNENKITEEDLKELVNKLGYDSIEDIKKEKTKLAKLEALLNEIDADNAKNQIAPAGNPKGAKEISEEDESIEDKKKKKKDEESSDDGDDDVNIDDLDLGVSDDGKDTEDTETTDDTESTEDTEDKEDTETTDDTESTEDTEDKEDTETTDDTESTEDTETTDDTESTEDTEDTEDDEESSKSTPKTRHIKTFAEFCGEDETNESYVFESEINSDDEFKEYAMKLLKKAHPDDFDENKANDTINGIIKDHKGDYGTMVGILQKSLAK